MLTARKYSKFLSTTKDSRVCFVTHKNCADGNMSAILHSTFDHRGFTPHIERVHYNTEELTNLINTTDEKFVFVDMTPPRDQIERYRTRGTVVIDHHVGAKDIVEAFGELGLYSAEPGDSGAYLYAKLLVDVGNSGDMSLTRRNLPGFQALASIIGIRDTWAKEGMSDGQWDAIGDVSEAIKFITPEPRQYTLDELTDICGVIGKALHSKRIESTADLLKKMDVTRIMNDGTGEFTSVGFVPSNHISDLADVAEVDLLVGFGFYSVDGMTVSLRSKKGLDCARIAKAIPRCGGGGHKGAAGFTVPSYEMTGPPIREILKCLGEPAALRALLDLPEPV